MLSYLYSDDGFYYSREELTKNHIHVHVEGSQDLPEDNSLSVERMKKKRVTLEQLEVSFRASMEYLRGKEGLIICNR
jgi:hypothetical protein